MSLEKTGRFIKNIFFKEEGGEGRGITIVPAVIASTLYGGVVATDLMSDPWDPALVENNTSIVAEFNEQANDIRGLHKKLEYLTKKQEIGAFEAEQNGQTWDETNMEWLQLIAQEKVAERQVVKQTDDYMTNLLLTDGLSEKQVYNLASSNDFPSYRVTFTAGAAESLREAQSEYSDRTDLTDAQKAQKISDLAQAKANDIAGAFGAIPGFLIGVFGMAGIAAAGQAMEERGRRRKKKPAKKLSRN